MTLLEEVLTYKDYLLKLHKDIINVTEIDYINFYEDGHIEEIKMPVFKSELIKYSIILIRYNYKLITQIDSSCFVRFKVKENPLSDSIYIKGCKFSQEPPKTYLYKTSNKWTFNLSNEEFSEKLVIKTLTKDIFISVFEALNQSDECKSLLELYLMRKFIECKIENRALEKEVSYLRFREQFFISNSCPMKCECNK